jgi:hypothetical protein
LNARKFKCRIWDGAYGGEVVAIVDAKQVELFGDQAIEDAAWRAWRREFAAKIDMPYHRCAILSEIY